MGMRVNRSQLAEVMGVTMATITAWVQRGMPVVERGGQGKQWAFDTADCIRWKVEQAVGEVLDPDGTGVPKAAGSAFEIARARKMQADAEAAEIKLEELRRRVVAVDEAVRIANDVFGAVRAKLLGLPTKLATKLAAATSRDDAKTILTDGVNDALEELVFDARRARRAVTDDEESDDDEDAE